MQHRHAQYINHDATTWGPSFCCDPYLVPLLKDYMNHDLVAACILLSTPQILTVAHMGRNRQLPPYVIGVATGPQGKHDTCGTICVPTLARCARFPDASSSSRS